MTQQSATTFEALLRRFPSFQDLGDDRLRWLAQRARPFIALLVRSCSGQTACRNIVFASLKAEDDSFMTIQAYAGQSHLAYSQPGDLVGWAGLVRRDPCEWLTAATPLKLIGFAADDFFTLERESESFARWLASSNSPAELMAVLEPSLRARVVAEPSEREVLRQLLPGIQVIPAAEQRTLPDDDAVWLGFSAPSGRSCAYW